MSDSEDEEIVFTKRKSRGAILNDDSDEEEKIIEKIDSPAKINDDNSIEDASISKTLTKKKRIIINSEDESDEEQAKDITLEAIESQPDILETIEQDKNHEKVLNNTSKDSDFGSDRESPKETLKSNEEGFSKKEDVNDTVIPEEELEENEFDDKRSDDSSDVDKDPVVKVGRWLDGKGASKLPTKSPKRTNVDISPKRNKKNSKNDLLQIHSETQRLIRESEIQLPYHRPKQFRTFSAFKKAIQFGTIPTEEEDWLPDSVRPGAEPAVTNDDYAKEPPKFDELLSPSADPVSDSICSPKVDSNTLDLVEDVSEANLDNEATQLHDNNVDLDASDPPQVEEPAADVPCEVEAKDKPEPGPRSLSAIKAQLASMYPLPKISGSDKEVIDLGDDVFVKPHPALGRFAKHQKSIITNKALSDTAPGTRHISIVKKTFSETTGREELELETVCLAPEMPSSTSQLELMKESSRRAQWREHRLLLKNIMRERRLKKYEEKSQLDSQNTEKKEAAKNNRDGMSDDDEEWNEEMEDTASSDSNSSATSSESEKEEEDDEEDEIDYKKPGKKAVLSFLDEEAESDGEDDEEKGGESDAWNQKEKIKKSTVDLDEDNDSDSDESDNLGTQSKDKWAQERRALCVRMAQNGLDQGDLDMFTSDYSLYMNQTSGTMKSYNLEDTLQNKLNESNIERKKRRLLSPYDAKLGSVGSHPPVIRGLHSWELSPQFTRDDLDTQVASPDKLACLVGHLKQKYGLAKHLTEGDSSVLLLPCGKTSEYLLKRYFKQQIRDLGDMDLEQFRKYEELLHSKEPKISSTSDFDFLGVEIPARRLDFTCDSSMPGSERDGDSLSSLFTCGQHTQNSWGITPPDDLFFSQQGVTQMSLLRSQSHSFEKCQPVEDLVASQVGTPGLQSQDTVLLSESQGPTQLLSGSSENLPFAPSEVITQPGQDNERRRLFGNPESQLNSSLPEASESQFIPDCFDSTGDDGRDDNHESRRALFGNNSQSGSIVEATDSQYVPIVSINSQANEDERRALFGGSGTCNDPVQSKAMLSRQDTIIFEDPPMPSQTQNDDELMSQPLFTCYPAHKKDSLTNSMSNASTALTDPVQEKSGSDDEEESVIIRRHNHAPKPAVDSDAENPEDEDIDDADLDDNVDLEDPPSDDEAKSDPDVYDEEEEMRREVLGIKPKKQAKYKARDFVESEAELSGSEVGSDEEEVGMDDYEMEEGDLDTNLPSVGQLRKQVERVHQRLEADKDHREIKFLQEMYLEDGELHGDNAGRKRNFRWLGLDNDEGGVGPAGPLDSDEEDQNAGDTSIVEDRLPFIPKAVLVDDADNDQDELDDADMSSQFISLGKKALLKKASVKENCNRGPILSDNHKPIAASLFTNSTNSKNTKVDDRPTSLTKRGSFLNRSGGDLARLQTMMRTADSASIRSKAGMLCFSVGGGAAMSEDMMADAQAPSAFNNKAKDLKRKSSESLAQLAKKSRLLKDKKLPLKQSTNSIFNALG